MIDVPRGKFALGNLQDASKSRSKNRQFFFLAADINICWIPILGLNMLAPDPLDDAPQLPDATAVGTLHNPYVAVNLLPISPTSGFPDVISESPRARLHQKLPCYYNCRPSNTSQSFETCSRVLSSRHPRLSHFSIVYCRLNKSCRANFVAMPATPTYHLIIQ